MLHQNPDMLLFIAIGDAYGAGFEFATRDFIKKHHTLKNYVPHPSGYLLPGKYTDDAQMSIAVAEALCAGGDLITGKFADAMVQAFNRDPRMGYTKGFYSILQECKTGSDMLAKVSGQTTKNGAAMRSVPLGAIRNSYVCANIAQIQAEVTHRTPEAVFSSKAVALMSNFALHEEGPLSELPYFLRDQVGGDFALMAKYPWKSEVVCSSRETVHAVLTVLLTAKTLSEVLKIAVGFGGDTDSVASIALGIASARLPNDLPKFLFDNLESGGAYGVEFLQALGERLMQRYA